MASAPLTIVIGAGISGLTCAYALKKSEQNVLLLEASPRPGGVIQSVEENGYLFELGPQSFSATSELAELCQELLLTEQVLETPRGAPRYILINHKLVNVPLSPALLTSRLLSWGTKLTFLRDILGKTSPPETDESIAAFVRRKFSAQLLDRLVGPFISGIYAGDPEQLSLRAAFPKLYEAEKAAASVIRGGLKLGAKAGKQTVTRPRTGPRLLSFRGGNETLVAALAAALGPALRCNVGVSEVRSAGNKFQIGTQSAAGPEEMTCDRVVLATPTDASAQILRGLVPGASAALESILYAPVAVVSLAYKQQQVARSLSGFGFLAPRSSGLRILGSVWNSSLFRARAPAGHVLLTNFVGGATDPSATKLSEEELAALVHREIAPILKITGVPEKVRTTRYSHAIPQYNLGHLERLQEIQDSIAQVPRLRLIGNYWKGPAIGTCVEQALAAAEEIRIS
ncbi:MAG TPA: protoporphyrinogen oxidase [Candidatus Acidoferrum sp.]|nr:protoporphyrinogen oxidase [Candidatus Acidoferrum sp.]